MGGYNMPDGVSERDIPGYYERDEDVDFECANEECEETWEDCVSVDPSSGGHDVESTCPKCGTETTTSWKPQYVEPYDDY